MAKRRKLSIRKIGRLIVVVLAVIALFVLISPSRDWLSFSNEKAVQLTKGPYNTDFDDLNDIQLVAAQANGLKKLISSRNLVEDNLSGLTVVENNADFVVEKLTHSIPYLTPQAEKLLHRIGEAFRDTLLNRCLPKHRIVVTSVLRTEEDVKKLRRVNRNATENSAHCYATTFDISSLRYMSADSITIPKATSPYAYELRKALEEVLRDLRHEGYCYVKREKRQHCYHITSRL